MKLIATLLLAATSSLLITAAALGQSGNSAIPDGLSSTERGGPGFQIHPLSPLPVPGTSTANPFTSFDTIFVDRNTQLMVLASRSSRSVALYNASTGETIGQTPDVFAGAGSDVFTAGPNGVVIAGDQLWVGDYPSTVRVFNLRASLSSPPQIAAIQTGGLLRADEMDYDPDDRLVAVTNADYPAGGGNLPFVTFLSTQTLSIARKVVFDGTGGTLDASRAGLGSVIYDSAVKKFLVSVPVVGADLTKSAIVELDPQTGDVTKVIAGIDNCLASGMAQGPGDNVVVGCDAGFPAPDPVVFSPRTYVVNSRSGAIVATIHQVGGEDQVWYNPGDRHYYTGSRDFFTNPGATAATPVLGVIDAETNQWVQNVPTGANAHSVAANPRNNRIYVPVAGPDPSCGAFAGCVLAFSSSSEAKRGQPAFAPGSANGAPLAHAFPAQFLHPGTK